MGRTIPSFRIAVTQEISVWAPFRKVLPKVERAIFDEMMSIAKLHVSASSAVLRALRFEGLIMSIIFHHYKELQTVAGEMYLINEKLGEENEFR